MLGKSGEFTLHSLEELGGQNCTGHMGTTGSNTTKRGNISICKFYSSSVLDKVSVWENQKWSRESENTYVLNEVRDLGIFKNFWVQVSTFPPIYDQQIQACLVFGNDMVTENSQEAGHK